MRDLICRARYGALRLATALTRWLVMATRLAEPPRRRKPRPERVAGLLATALP